jgi:hypothetical protein
LADGTVSFPSARSRCSAALASRMRVTGVVSVTKTPMRISCKTAREPTIEK